MDWSEADTKAKFIDPKLKQSQWDETMNILREESFTLGRKFVGNVRGDRCYFDYLLKYNNKNLAIIEAKRYSEEPTKGLEQVKNYGDKLKVRFVYSTNGDKIYQYDLNTGKGEFVDKFPSPQELFDMTVEKKNSLKEKLLNIPYNIIGNIKPRYYQEIAVNKALESIADGNQRVLLTLATGTGKTFIAFQIVRKLFQAKWNTKNNGNRPRVLFLADRNFLVDQAMNTFNPMENDIIKLKGSEIRKRGGKIPSANVYFAIYQAISEKENIKGYYKLFPQDFFDLVIVDECHRGGANEEGTWHDILQYFSSAVHLGLTATPKRQDNIDTYNYFGEPVYQYSLKEGINDGFLTPYKVKRIQTNLDEFVLNSSDEVIKGEPQKSVYEINDHERSIVIQERSDLIAQAILDNIDFYDKTVVFCVNQPHALRIRDSINKYKSVNDPNYCVRVTSDEGKLGRQFLESFQDNDKTVPVILTTSQMLTTGVDAKNIRNIVLLKQIGSMVEFKQIIGRGTRLFDGKDYFNIIDFVGATNKFYDHEWDGEPTEPIKNSKLDISDEDYEGEEIIKDEQKERSENPEEDEGGKNQGKPETLEVRLGDNREIKIINIETRYIDENGKPLSADDFIQKLVGNLPSFYQSYEELKEIWADPASREELLQKLYAMGIDSEQLKNLRKMFQAQECDVFDILAYISFNSDMKKRSERVRYVRDEKDILSGYTDFKAREFLDFLLRQYEQNGIFEFKSNNLKGMIELFHSTPTELSQAFGSSEKLREAYLELQREIYEI